MNTSTMTMRSTTRTLTPPSTTGTTSTTTAHRRGPIRRTRPRQVPLSAEPALRRILLVEDDLNISLALRVRLQAEGFDVVTARDATQGLNIAVLRPPHLVLLDYMLPDHDGLWMAEQLQARVETRRTPFAFLTASRQPGLAEHFAAQGARGLLTKPFASEDLIELVEGILFDAPGDGLSGSTVALWPGKS